MEEANVVSSIIHHTALKLNRPLKALKPIPKVYFAGVLVV